MKLPCPLSLRLVYAHTANSRLHPLVEVWVFKKVSCFFTVILQYLGSSKLYS